MKKAIIAVAALAVLGASSQAQAIGCLSGAAAGGVAGHYAGHHTVLGALGGCVVGHQLHKKQKRKKQQLEQQQALPAQPAIKKPTAQ
ncbi:hypothetical protein LGH82_17540 [Mesorhizobium sp. PAMC28654]|uniref:hypothetical protein n=1 Tax=Mesorhizobium sp. PAMC28654 TaxID=2880934 RepID=UPI001D0AB389|nr:hypothetical protein [Mesorhizobium sp. PAMC28654]UDL87022.1 hypothetical protein LGH82_17540 [Mesorhizobium sp. PAMC28654]